MKKYNRVMLGHQSVFAKMCRKENYIGVDFDIHEDLSDSLYENWRDFNKKFIKNFLIISCVLTSPSFTGLIVK